MLSYYICCQKTQNHLNEALALSSARLRHWLQPCHFPRASPHRWFQLVLWPQLLNVERSNWERDIRRAPMHVDVCIDAWNRVAIGSKRIKDANASTWTMICINFVHTCAYFQLTIILCQKVAKNTFLEPNLPAAKWPYDALPALWLASAIQVWPVQSL